MAYSEGGSQYTSVGQLEAFINANYISPTNITYQQGSAPTLPNCTPATTTTAAGTTTTAAPGTTTTAAGTTTTAAGTTTTAAATTTTAAPTTTTSAPNFSCGDGSPQCPGDFGNCVPGPCAS